MPLLAHRVSELSMASGTAMRMPVPRSLLSTATAPMGPIMAIPSAPTPRVGSTALSASRSPLCCDDILYPAVSLKIWLILAEAVSLPDISTVTLISPATSNVEAKTRSPVPFSAGVDSPVRACWSTSAMPFDHVPVDRDDLAGVDDDDVTFLELVGRHLDLGRRRGRARHTSVACRTRSRAASASYRATCFTRKRPKLRHQQQTAPGKIDMVPRQPTITTASSASTPIRFSSTNTRLASLSVGIDVYAYKHRRRRQERRGHELGRRRQGERGRADGQVHVELVERRRLLGAGQGGVEDLDHLRLGQLLGVVVNQDRTGERIRREPVDPQHARQLALDRLAELILAKEDRVLEAEPAGQVGLDLPVGHERVVAVVTDRPLGRHEPAVEGRATRVIFDARLGPSPGPARPPPAEATSPARERPGSRNKGRPGLHRPP